MGLSLIITKIICHHNLSFLNVMFENHKKCSKELLQTMTLLLVSDYSIKVMFANLTIQIDDLSLRTAECMCESVK